MSTTTKRFLIGSGVAFLCAVVIGILARLLFDDSDVGPGATTMWLTGSLFEIVTLAMLVGAGISFLVQRVRSSS